MNPKTILDAERYLEDTAAELNELASFDRMEMYRHLTNLGSRLAQYGQPPQIPENFVPGCTSNVYIAAETRDNRIQYQGFSEALIVRGYVAILVEALSGLTLEEVVNQTAAKVGWFSEATDIRATLTPSRANAFGNVYRLMQQKARFFLTGNLSKL